MRSTSTRETTTMTLLCVAGYGILSLLYGASSSCPVVVQAKPFGTGSLHHQRMRLWNPTLAAANRRSISSSSSISVLRLQQLRGGSSIVAEENSEDDDEDVVEEDEEEVTTEDDITNHPEFAKVQSYRMQQQVLMQLRATILSEALAKRGLPIPTLLDVQTPDGALPPQMVDWDCSQVTEEVPKPCLYSFDAQPGTKVVGPINTTTEWISLASLNRLRRTDPSKVEPMWHSKYSILSSWFDSDSEYSLLQHVGITGLLLNFVLQGSRLHLVLGVTLTMTAIVFMPILEFLVNRLLVSGLVWGSWPNWARFLHAALPLKLLLGQLAFKGLWTLFLKLVKLVKDWLVEVECQILEQSIPLTVGPGSEVIVDDDDDDVDDDEEGLDIVTGDWDDEEDDTLIDFDDQESSAEE